jgi:endonuclease/exonuclease/phosphatase family metal-dependent hydrolase
MADLSRHDAQKASSKHRLDPDVQFPMSQYLAAFSRQDRTISLRQMAAERGRRQIRRLSLGLSKATSSLSAPLFYSERRVLASPPSQVPAKAADHLRFFSLNVAHARRNVPVKPYLGRRKAQRNLAEIAETLKLLAPDVVALQEVDGPSTWSGNFDHVATIAQQSGFAEHYRGDHNEFGIGRFRMAAGTALMARQPLLDPASHRFSVSWRDTKGFVVAALEVPVWGGLSVDVVSVHLDFLTPSVRREQIRRMVERLADRRRPLVVLGDLNCCWQHEPRSMELLVSHLGLRAHEPQSPAHTYPAHRPNRRIDWILASPELDFHGYHTVHALLSDHLVLVADLTLRQTV